MEVDSSPAADVRKRKALLQREREDVENLPTHMDCSTTTSITKQICFWGKSNLRNLDWFVVNISVDPKQQQDEVNELAAFDHQLLHHNHNYTKNKPLTPVFSFPCQSNVVPLIFNSFATLDSFIYSVGGLLSYPIGGDDSRLKDSTRSGSNLVHYFDTRSSSSSCRWEKAPSMISHRRRPQVVTLNRILYVFGCSGHEKCRHEPSCCVWAEAFDPSTATWSSLPVPEFGLSLVVSSPSHAEKGGRASNKISAITDNDYFYEFDVETRCWTCLANCGGYSIGYSIGADMGRPVLVDNVLYWFEDTANAYDVLELKYFEGPVQDLSFQRLLCLNPDEFEFYGSDAGADKPAIVHLGGRYFCLLAYLRDVVKQKDTPMRIHCLVIEVSTTNECYEQHYGNRSDIDKFFLNARVLSCQSFDIDRKLEFIDGRVMII